MTLNMCVVIPQQPSVMCTSTTMRDGADFSRQRRQIHQHTLSVYLHSMNSRCVQLLILGTVKTVVLTTKEERITIEHFDFHTRLVCCICNTGLNEHTQILFTVIKLSLVKWSHCDWRLFLINFQGRSRGLNLVSSFQKKALETKHMSHKSSLTHNNHRRCDEAKSLWSTN